MPAPFKAPDSRDGQCICQHAEDISPCLDRLSRVPADAWPNEVISAGAEIIPKLRDALLDRRNDAFDAHQKTRQQVVDLANERGLRGEQAVRFIPVYQAAHAYFQAVHAFVTQE